VKLANHVAGTGHDDKIPAPSGEHDALIGRTIAGKFVVERRLGAGSMGAVYSAQQTALERAVAIKVMHATFAADSGYAARFHLEAKAASRLDHPNLIRVHDYGQEPDGLLYIVMEYLDCRDLFTVLEDEWPLTHERIVELLTQTLSGLGAVHDAGVLHRDLKPENILVLRRKREDGVPVEVVKLSDFGIAKLVEPPGGTDAGAPGARRRLTTAGLVVGTPEYMSPEQARGEGYDVRSDVYAVGVILYQLLTRRLPFQAKTAVEVVFKAMHEEPEPLGANGPTAAPGLDAICLKAMSKRPEDRYESARAMHAALRATRVEAAALPSRAPAPARAEAARSRSRWGAGGLLGVAALGAITSIARVFLSEQRTPLSVATPTLPPTSSAAPVEVSGLPGDPSPAPSPLPSSDLLQPPARSSATSSAANARQTSHEPSPRSPPLGVEAVPFNAGDPPRSSAPTAVPPSPAVAPPTPLSPLSSPRPPPPFNLATAKVVLGKVKSNSAAATSIGIGSALKPFATKFTACYRGALAQTGRASGETVATLHLESDDEGYVTVARVIGAPSPSAAQCIEALGREVHLQVDMGTADADVTLKFEPM
jgi:serine/threonine-protein kinase